MKYVFVLKNLFFLSLFLFLFSNVSCNTKIKSENNKVHKVLTDTCNSISTVKSFLFWYEKNIDELNRILVLKEKDNEQYRIDFIKVDDYINFLKLSGLFSLNFLENKKKYFEKCDNNFLKTKQQDGPPEGLDYDLFLFCQDYIVLFDGIKQISYFILKRTNLYTFVSINYEDNYNLIFKIDNKCKIDDITPKNVWIRQNNITK